MSEENQVIEQVEAFTSAEAESAVEALVTSVLQGADIAQNADVAAMELGWQHRASSIDAKAYRAFGETVRTHLSENADIGSHNSLKATLSRTLKAFRVGEHKEAILAAAAHAKGITQQRARGICMTEVSKKIKEGKAAPAESTLTKKVQAANREADKKSNAATARQETYGVMAALVAAGEALLTREYKAESFDETEVEKFQEEIRGVLETIKAIDVPNQKETAGTKKPTVADLEAKIKQLEAAAKANAA